VTIDINESCATWNDFLRSHSSTFLAESTQATVVLFSAHAIVTEILDDPLNFDFGEDDVGEANGVIWVDELHLSSAAHSIIAGRLNAVLESLAGPA